MNKLIRRLANQASNQINMTGLHNIPDEFLEKFAELIVRECDKHVSTCYDECEPWMQPGDLLDLFKIRK